MERILEHGTTPQAISRKASPRRVDQFVSARLLDEQGAAQRARCILRGRALISERALMRAGRLGRLSAHTITYP